MLTAGCVRFNAAGRVIISLSGPVVAFNGGTPVNIDGAIVVEDNPPDAYVGGFGFKANQPICARQGLGNGTYIGGFARDSVGGLALALDEPITGYIAGIPVVADGRVAVVFEGPIPPIDTGAFSNGFSNGFDIGT